jgi:hypothetical protein
MDGSAIEQAAKQRLGEVRQALAKNRSQFNALLAERRILKGLLSGRNGAAATVRIGTQQAAVLEILCEHSGPMELRGIRAAMGNTSSRQACHDVLRQLINKGLARRVSWGIYEAVFGEESESE